MKTLLLPFAITVLPFIVLFILLWLVKRKRTLSTPARILTGFAFALMGLACSFYAFALSIDGMSEKGVRCLTGAVTFPFFGVILYLVGNPLLLIFYPGMPVRRNQRLEPH